MFLAWLRVIRFTFTPHRPDCHTVSKRPGNTQSKPPLWAIVQAQLVLLQHCFVRGISHKEWQRLWGEERPIVAGQRPKLDDTVVIRGLVSKAIVAPVMPQWRDRIAEWNRSERDKDHHFVSVCYFCIVCLCVLCLFVKKKKNQPTQAFPNPGISSLALQETEKVGGCEPCGCSRYAPFCAHGAASIVE